MTAALMGQTSSKEHTHTHLPAPTVRTYTYWTGALKPEKKKKKKKLEEEMSDGSTSCLRVMVWIMERGQADAFQTTWGAV